MALRARGDGAAGRAGVKIGVNSEHRVLTPYVGATLIFYTDWWRYTAPQHQSLVLIQLSPVAGVNLFSVRSVAVMGCRVAH